MALASEKLETGLKGGGSQGSVFPSQLCLAFILQILPKWWARRSLTAIVPSFAAPRKPFPSVCKAVLKWTLLVLFWILGLQHPSVITEPGGTGYFDKSGSRGCPVAVSLQPHQDHVKLARSIPTQWEWGWGTEWAEDIYLQWSTAGCSYCPNGR